MPDEIQTTMVGWREWAALPQLGVAAVKTKIDTGARTSALHVEAIEEYQIAGRRWVRFALALNVRKTTGLIHREMPVHDVRPVTDSGGHRAERFFILTPLLFAGRLRMVEMNLAYRATMKFPMLLGRTALVGDFIVNPAKSFLLGKRRPSKEAVSSLNERWAQPPSERR